MVERGEDDSGGDLDRRCGGGDCATHHGKGWHVAVVDKVVFRRPYRRETEALCFDRQSDGLVVGPRPIGFARAELGAQQSEAETHREYLHMRPRLWRSELGRAYDRLVTSRVDLDERFTGDTLDPDIWFPYYLPHWSSRSQSAATYSVHDGELHLRIPDGPAVVVRRSA